MKAYVFYHSLFRDWSCAIPINSQSSQPAARPAIPDQKPGLFGPDISLDCTKAIVSIMVDGAIHYVCMTGSTSALSPKHPEINVRWNLASATWRGVLHPCQVFVPDFGMWR